MKGRRRDAMTVVEHLEELRRRLIWSLVALGVGAGVGFYLERPILAFLLRPAFPLGVHKLVFLSPTEALFTYIKISMVVGAILASPVWLYELVAYVLPAMEARERRYLYLSLPPVALLFVAGLAFGYFVFVPMVFRFLFRFAGPELVPMLSISKYISSLLSFTLPFGVVFELPAVVALLTRLGVISAAFLRRQRRWAILLIFVVAAIFTPPDPFSQLVMASPMLVLYEASILVAAAVERRRPQPAAEADD